MNEHHLSYRALADLTRAADLDGRGVSHAYLCALVAGREYPSRRAMQLLATSLHIDPDRFAEYRIAELRDQLNGREVGLPSRLEPLPRARQLTAWPITRRPAPTRPPGGEVTQPPDASAGLLGFRSRAGRLPLLAASRCP